MEEMASLTDPDRGGWIVTFPKALYNTNGLLVCD